jgi:crotonobetainyl-CoA:carnitine CoA-transferase CaiB-like acyl-CoA transferase
VYATKDERVLQFCAIERKFWDAFCAGIDRPDLADHWSSDQDYYFGDEDLRVELEAIFRERTADEWFTDFVKWSIPATPVLTIDDLVEHPHLEARGLIDPAPAGTVPNIADPVRVLDTGARPGRGSARPPAVGADTEAVLRSWLGRDGSDA